MDMIMHLWGECCSPTQKHGTTGMREFECVSNRVQFHSTELYKGLQNICTGLAQTLLIGVWVNGNEEDI